MGQDEDEVGLGALLTEGRVVEMLRFGRVLTGDRYSAEDLVQDVLVALFERGANLPPIANWGGYTRRMMVNRYVSLHRKSSRGRPVELLWSSEPTESEPVDYAVTTRDELGAALAQLPPGSAQRLCCVTTPTSETKRSHPRLGVRPRPCVRTSPGACRRCGSG
jgi:hypothetical protein